MFETILKMYIIYFYVYLNIIYFILLLYMIFKFNIICNMYLIYV